MWYAILPLVGWFVSGVTKFLINTIRFGREEGKKRAGNGGFPSTHTTTVTSPVAYIGWMEGVNTPMFSLGVAFLMITIIDATGIRRAIGEHAKRINQQNPDTGMALLRESQGHTRIEVLGGLVLGILIGYAAYLLS
ncbi:divergent PAP2 family protein [Tumebacillus sp. DT12]|uniref:Divergent PAP2 family protein n=1 Tax=Tumebacillus lacus TaxID=2995335 RepID=A0ABT3WYE7_9BACL|nr:divergent PAP2 family protein [Tumebacillus lacus]MCX7569685.1 divergent PAP2 family protein [Tumebacillus lacus]